MIRSNRSGENSRVSDLRHVTGCGMASRITLPKLHLVKLTQEKLFSLYLPSSEYHNHKQ